MKNESWCGLPSGSKKVTHAPLDVILESVQCQTKARVVHCSFSVGVVMQINTVREQHVNNSVLRSGVIEESKR